MELELSDTIKNKDEDIIIAVDSSGVKVTNRGEWMREKWRIHRGWIKAHIAVNVNTKEIVAIEVTDEQTSDGDKFEDLIEVSEETIGYDKIKRALGDGAYDTKGNFSFLHKKGIESGIKTRKDASTKAKGSPYRAKCVRERKKLGYDEWKKKYDYGMRWVVEGTYSSVKRIFGESVRASSNSGMFKEVIMKFTFYNMLLNWA
ncbi:MAG: hypothetical protein AEth_01377 [Candidatus Argoarchaeum ethanivorans]|uniref:Transposase IS4-like domain-containing protein n=1 Tax=Candidatus Argoarchaeum ethanivorans TaxID=2608793 RepID=A0A8B3S179_9EURY|nr:MAG: hypothetical protein AEth_01377 [Candidatus Argoarchaeum ethanivorans]